MCAVPMVLYARCACGLWEAVLCGVARARGAGARGWGYLGCYLIVTTHSWFPRRKALVSSPHGTLSKGVRNGFRFAWQWFPRRLARLARLGCAPVFSLWDGEGAVVRPNRCMPLCYGLPPSPFLPVPPLLTHTPWTYCQIRIFCAGSALHVFVSWMWYSCACGTGAHFPPVPARSHPHLGSRQAGLLRRSPFPTYVTVLRICRTAAFKHSPVARKQMAGATVGPPACGGAGSAALPAASGGPLTNDADVSSALLTNIGVGRRYAEIRAEVCRIARELEGATLERVVRERF